jgi:hypothetical protein
MFRDITFPRYLVEVKRVRFASVSSFRIEGKQGTKQKFSHWKITCKIRTVYVFVLASLAVPYTSKGPRVPPSHANWHSLCSDYSYVVWEEQNSFVQ